LISVSVGIPAYNEEKNIKFVLNSVLAQKENDSFKIGEILVVSDGSVDATPDVVREYRAFDSRIRLYHYDVRRGKCYALNVIFREGHGDVFVLFDADVILRDEWVVCGLVEPFLVDKRVGLVGGLPVPLPPEGLIELAGTFSFKLQKFIKENVRGGCNLYAAHGRVLALSSKLAKSIKVPSTYADDAYLYLRCISAGYKFVFVGEKATVFYRAPRNVKGFVSQSVRFRRALEPLRKIFGELVDREVKVPMTTFLKAYIKGLIEDPRGGFLWTLLYSYATLTIKRTPPFGLYFVDEQSKPLFT